MTPKMENKSIQYLGWTGGPPFFIFKKPKTLLEAVREKFELSEFFLPLLPKLPVYS